MRWNKYLTIFALLLLSSVLVFAAGEKVISLDFELGKDDSVSDVSLKVLQGSADAARAGEYKAELLSGSGEVLHAANFDASFEAFADFFGEEGSVETPGEAFGTDSVSISLKLPYSNKVASYRISKGTTVLSEGPVSFCNKNGVCDAPAGENFLSCAADCSSGASDEYCDAVVDDVCDPDCDLQGQKDKDTDCTCGDGVCGEREDSFSCAVDCGSSNKFKSYLYGGIAVVVLIFLLIVWGIVHHVRKKRAASVA
jgi:hypothetical protein